MIQYMKKKSNQFICIFFDNVVSFVLYHVQKKIRIDFKNLIMQDTLEDLFTWLNYSATIPIR